MNKECYHTKCPYQKNNKCQAHICAYRIKTEEELIEWKKKKHYRTKKHKK